jgi:hypothetical protein
MGSFGDYLENKVLDKVWGNVDFSASGNMYIALSTADPLDDASGIAEPVGNNYSRVTVANNTTNWNTASGGATSNKTAIEFPEASGSWGTISHFAIFDDPTAGNLLGHGELTVHKAVISGDVLRFKAGDLGITLD